MRKNLFTIFVLGFFAGLQLFAQETRTTDTKRVTVKVPSEIKIAAGRDTSIQALMTVKKPYYFYGLESDPNGGKPLEITSKTKNVFTIAGKITGTKAHAEYDSTFEVTVQKHKGTANFSIPVRVANLAPGKYQAVLNFYGQACDTVSCKDFDDDFTISFIVEKSDAPLSRDSAAFTPAVVSSPDGTEKISAAPVQNMTESQQEIENKKKEGIFSFLWFAMTAGALSLLTPCVFPMIPITVSFFTKRTEVARGKGLRDSLVYALGIISTFTAIGFVVSLVFGSTGISNFATNPWTNLFIGAIFIIFALNLFGAFEIQVPTKILNSLNRSSQGDGVTSVLLMGLTFSLTSFTCTVPFVGSALISASSGEWFYPIIGMLGFSAVFAAPFFLLALFPSAMSKLPKSGGWMNSVKVVMGFLEIAAAMKFLSNVDLVWSWGILSRELFLAIWIACAVLITLYVLGLFVFKLDSPVDRIGGVRALFAVGFGAIAFYLLSGLYGKPLGELDAYLPPPDYHELVGNAPQTASAAGGGAPVKTASLEENWLSDYKAAISEAKRTGKPVFIDFTGFTCTNCRWMERNVFPKGHIASLMNNMVKVRLYTDRRGEPYESNKKLQQERYGSIELPLYVILTPDEKLVGTKAFTRNEQEFLDFLQKGAQNQASMR